MKLFIIRKWSVCRHKGIYNNRPTVSTCRNKITILLCGWEKVARILETRFELKKILYNSLVQSNVRVIKPDIHKVVPFISWPKINIDFIYGPTH